MHLLSLFLCLPLLLFSVACHADEATMTRILHQQPTVQSLTICHNGGCADVSHVSLSDEEWRQVMVVFDPPPLSAEDERTCIADAIGVLEFVVGPHTGTSADRAGTFGNAAYSGQMDCNDEAINTTNYIKLMQQAGLIHFHEVLDIHRRGFFWRGWPHSTAAIRERSSGVVYAVDAWFHDNGVPAEIVPMPVWKSGWKPSNSTAR